MASTPEPANGFIDRLMQYSWPGNVRELENVVEREMILNTGGPLTFNRLDHEYLPPETPADSHGEGNRLKKLDEAMTDHILAALRLSHGIIHGPRGAAAILGLNANTLRSRMGKLGIRKNKAND